MDDISILTKDLRSNSLSDREIVLRHKDAIEAVEMLCNSNWLILGWEIWFRYPNGQISHFFEHDGTTWIEASDWDIDEKEEWRILVKDLAEQCKYEITNSETYWRDKCKVSGVEPFFCITATDSLRGGEK